jgi:hypothetical protein
LETVVSVGVGVVVVGVGVVVVGVGVGVVVVVVGVGVVVVGVGVGVKTPASLRMSMASPIGIPVASATVSMITSAVVVSPPTVCPITFLIAASTAGMPVVTPVSTPP